MPTQINKTTPNPLRGRPLRDLTMQLLQQIGSSREFAVARMQASWQGDRIAINAPNLMTGSVTFRDGNPSTVTIQMVLTGVAELPAMQRRLAAALDNAAAQLRAGQVPAGAPAAQPGAPTTTTRRQRDPGRAADMFDAISRAFEQGVQQVFGRPAAPTPEEQVEVMMTQPGVTPGRLRPTGKPLPPGGAGYEAPLQPYYQERDVPWGMLLAGGAVAVTGVVLIAKAIKTSREEREER